MVNRRLASGGLSQRRNEVVEYWMFRRHPHFSLSNSPRPMGSAHGVNAKHDAGHDNSAHAHRESED